MFKNWLRGAMAVAMVAGFAGQAGAIGLAGNYHETNGIIINIPQNQPLSACDAAADNARCHFKQQLFFGQGAGATSAPYIGVTGTATGIPENRVANSPFTLPANFMTQNQTEDAQVLNNVAIYLITSFQAEAPVAQRAMNQGIALGSPGHVANPDTRAFDVRTFGTVLADGQNNGLATTDGNYLARAAVNTTVMDVFAPGSSERITMTYSGGNGFSGTAGLLLDGGGELFIGGPNIDALGTTMQAPLIGRNPLGDGIAGNLVTRNGVGWGFVINGGQDPGTLKTFGLDPHNPLPGGFCTTTAAPALPAGCNIVTGFDTNGGPGPFPLPAATSDKYVFAWTTGTVTLVHNATRMQGALNVLQTLTLRGDGHDNVTAGVGTPGGSRRNVGLVAGSYTKRTDGFGAQQINAQLAGMNLIFTPEPASAVALFAGIGLLGTMAARRRR